MKKQIKSTLALLGLLAGGFAVANSTDSISLDDLTAVAAQEQSVSACVVQPNSDCLSTATGNIYIGRTAVDLGGGATDPGDNDPGTPIMIAD